MRNMCEVNEKELNQEVELDETEGYEEQEYFTQDEVYDIIERVTPKIEVNTDSIQGFEIDEQEYRAGIQSMSFLVGQISVLKSAGVSEDFIREMILNRETIEHNQTLQRLNNDSSEKIAKIQQANQEQNQI